MSPALSADPTHHSTHHHKAVVRRFLDALVEEDTVALRPLVTDDVRWWVPPSAGTNFGLDRPLEGWDGIPWFGGEGWKGFKPGTSAVTVHHLVAEGDLVSAHYNRVAERVSGTRYDNEYNILFRLEEGRIAEVWEVVDTAYANSTRD
jgi:ketosteroid isomerase-like protein